CNLVTVEDEQMRDFTAGHIGDDEARALMATIQEEIGGMFLPEESFKGIKFELEFRPGVSYRNLLVVRPTGLPAPFSDETRTQPPHDIPDRPIAEYLPRGPGADLLRGLMQDSREVLRDHPVNRARVAQGKRPATQVWLWGQGRAPRLRPF